MQLPFDIHIKKAKDTRFFTTIHFVIYINQVAVYDFYMYKNKSIEIKYRDEGKIGDIYEFREYIDALGFEAGTTFYIEKGIEQENRMRISWTGKYTIPNIAEVIHRIT